MRTSICLAATLAMALSLGSDPVKASSLASTSTQGTFESSGGPVDLPLVPTSRTGFTFTTVAASTDVIVSFTAECAIEGNPAAVPAPSARVDLDILVDGVSLAPLNSTSDAFCSSNSTFDLDQLKRTGAHVVARVGSGSHTVKVRATARSVSGGAIVTNKFQLNRFSVQVHN
jgi:hypothetical protein